MEFERIRHRHTHINIAPLVDMVFLLLLFFMLTYQAVADHGIEISLPKAESSTLQEKSEVEILVDAGGELYIEQSLIMMDDLPEILDALFVSKDQPLIIRADKQASVGILVNVMDAGRSSGFSRISVITEKH
ncbi:ExbD/TolR family protein [Desulfonatronovibrio hydrogenovorans]|uniref:ExbD/TolR family protein n=1 Tax=Desulfonatronovibrio hydrogenovorans TaxID=53245 RepID=UPI00048BCD90|nr:biopolymer transporter ExbD [Desulfonatronovibrio hydrogenovorans]